MTTHRPRAIHQLRWRTPSKANGKRDGLRSTPTNAQRTTNPSATAAMTHMTGLPATVRATMVGQKIQRAMNGHATGAGRTRQMAQAVTPNGMAHHSRAGSAVKATNNGMAFGAYRMSPIWMGYGPASWYGW